MMGAYDYFTLKDLEVSIAAMPANTTEVNVKINSGGGLVTEGFAIHDRLVALDVPVNTEILGMCGSIATIISQAPKSQGKGGIRAMHPNSEFFIHNPAYVPNSGEAQTASDLNKIAADLTRTQIQLADFYAKVSGADTAWLDTKMAAETTLTASEAKSNGLIDEILGAQIQAFTKYKLVAITQTNKNTMANELKAEIKSGFASIEKLFTNLLKGKKVNMTVKTTEGVDIYFDGELTEGTLVFADEAMTVPAPDGVHTYEGKLYTVTAGVVTKVEDVAVDKTELEIANEKIAALEAQIAAKDSELVTAKAEVTEVLNTATELEKQFVNFKAQIVSGGKEIFEVAAVERNDKGQFKKSTMQEIADARAAKEAAKTK